MCKRHRADDVTDDFARGTASSLSEPSEPALQERWVEGAEVKLTTQDIAWDAVPPPTTGNTAEAVIVGNFETALILHAQRPSFTAVEQDGPDH